MNILKLIFVIYDLKFILSPGRHILAAYEILYEVIGEKFVLLVLDFLNWKFEAYP